MHRIARILAALIVISAAAACGEKPSRGDPERGHAYNLSPQNSLHERTLEQGESERMSH